MSEYGITDAGFVRKPDSQIRQDKIDRLREMFGEDFDITGMNPIIKIAEVEVDDIAELWDLAEDIYNAKDLPNAVGIDVDKSLNNIGLTRKDAVAAYTTITFVKTNATSITVPSGTLVDNGLTGDSLVTYETDEFKTLPEVVRFYRGTVGNTDLLSSQDNASHLFDAQDVAWVAANPDGTGPYTEGVDFVAYVAGADAITWGIGGVEPVAGTYYYVKFVGMSARLDATCTETGIKGNVQSRELNHLPSPISGITNVYNDNDVTTGKEEETDNEAISRGMKASHPQMNDEDHAAEILNLPDIRSAKIVEHLGWFEMVVAAWRSPIPQEVYDETLAHLREYKYPGPIPCHILRLTRKMADPNGFDEFPDPYNDVEGVLWVSDNYDGSSPYTEIVDYAQYNSGNDTIDWSPGGAEPAGGSIYYAKLKEALVIAYEVQIRILGTVTLASGYTLTQINDDALDLESAHFNALQIDESVYKETTSAFIIDHIGVIRLQDFRFEVIMRMERGNILGGTDTLPLENGSIISIDYVAENEDGSGTVYTDPADYLLSGFDIDWSPGGAEPGAGEYYYVKAVVDADIIIGDWEIAKLTGVDLV